MRVVRQKSAILASFATLLYTSTTLAVFVSLTTLAVTNVRSLDIYTIFLTVVLIRMVRLSSSSLFASSFNYISEYSSSVYRIQTFLHAEETPPLSITAKPSKSKRYLKSRSFLDLTKTEMSEFISTEDVNKIQSNIKKAGSSLDVRGYNDEFANNAGQDEALTAFVSSNNMTCYWDNDNKPPAILNLTFRANAKELTLINGPAGCGKTSLLLAILRELPPLEGTIIHDGNIAYVPQNPMIFTESFRNNIIFGKSFNPFRYQAVVNACNLQKLLEKLPDGDLTMIGSQV